MSANLAWTDERIERLKAMWEKGLTASQIADELSGVSRNAVIGKAHRLGLKARPSPVRTAEKSPRSSAEPAKAETPAVAASAPASAAAPSAPATAPAKAAKRTEKSPADGAPPVAQPVDSAAPAIPPRPDAPRVVSIGPGGFMRQGPGETQAPIPPAPPRRLVPAKPSAEIVGKTSLLDLNDRVCRWPMGHPGEPDFHFCGQAVNPGFPYCVQHCGRAYQAQLPRGVRRPTPPLPFGGPRVR